jgi:uroporphyrinogen III methyltransferase/synthase
MRALLEARGARVIEFPTIAIAPVADPADMERALKGEWDMIVVGSRHAVDAIADRARMLGRVLRAPIACVGDKTRAHLLGRIAEGQSALAPSSIIMPGVRRAEALAEAIALHFAPAGGVAKKRILYPRAGEGREILIELLRSEGASVEPVIAYRIAAAPAPGADLVDRIRSADAFTFLSGETLRRFFDLLGETAARAMLERCAVALIGPVAKEAADALGVRVDVVPETASSEHLVHALEAFFGGERGPANPRP